MFKSICNFFGKYFYGRGVECANLGPISDIIMANAGGFTVVHRTV